MVHHFLNGFLITLVHADLLEGTYENLQIWLENDADRASLASGSNYYPYLREQGSLNDKFFLKMLIRRHNVTVMVVSAIMHF